MVSGWVGRFPGGGRFPGWGGFRGGRARAGRGCWCAGRKKERIGFRAESSRTEDGQQWTCLSFRRRSCSGSTAFPCRRDASPARLRRPARSPRTSRPPVPPGSWSKPRSRPAAAARQAGSSWPTARTRRRPGRNEILGMDIKGHTVHAVLVEEASDIAREFYLSFLRGPGRAHLHLDLLGAGRHGDRGGGARTSPAAVAQIDRPARPASTRRRRPRSCRPAGCPTEAVAGAAAAAERLWAVFTDEDATLVEVNPLILTSDGRVVALDGKVTLDDNAAFRQDHERFADPGAADPLEARAKAKHLNYVKLEGEVGIIGNGAGLVMSTLDVVAQAGRGVRRDPARELPRHRRRCLGRGDGQRPGDRAVRPQRPQRARQRVRRHHLVRRGRQRHRVGAGHARPRAASR